MEPKEDPEVMLPGWLLFAFSEEREKNGQESVQWFIDAIKNMRKQTLEEKTDGTAC